MIKRLATNIDQKISLILKKVTCNLITYDNKKKTKKGGKSDTNANIFKTFECKTLSGF